MTGETRQPSHRSRTSERIAQQGKSGRHLIHESTAQQRKRQNCGCRHRNVTRTACVKARQTEPENSVKLAILYRRRMSCGVASKCTEKTMAKRIQFVCAQLCSRAVSVRIRLAVIRPPQFAPGDKPTIPGLELCEVVGQGAFSVVYRCIRNEEELAIKVQRAASETDESPAVLARKLPRWPDLRHPHLCTVRCVGEVGNRLYIAMTFIEGPTQLNAFQENLRRSRRHRSLSQIARRSPLYTRGRCHSRRHQAGNVLLDAEGTSVSHRLWPRDARSRCARRRRSVRNARSMRRPNRSGS